MLPSMYQPVESELFPPDVCYSDEVSSISSNNAFNPQNIDEESVDPAEEVLCDDEYPNSNEGAVGGELPDLCSTTDQIISSLEDCSGVKEIIVPTFRIGVSRSTDEGANHDEVNKRGNVNEELVSSISSNQCDKLLTQDSSSPRKDSNLGVHANSSETADFSSEDNSQNESEMSHQRASSSDSVRRKLNKNLPSKSNNTSPTASGICSIKCSAMIPSHFLTPISLQSHGMYLGYVRLLLYFFPLYLPYLYN